MIVISDARASDLLTDRAVREAVEAALIAASDGSGIVNPVIIGQGTSAGATFSIKSATSSRDRILGLKVGSYWPGNESRGLPRHGSTTLLLDPDSGMAMAAVGAQQLNGRRTAAADAIAAGHLARSDARTLSIIGTGNQARHEAWALLEALSLSRALVVGRDAERTHRFCDELAEATGKDVMSSGLEEACRQADILVTATTSRSPLFAADWIRPGTHVASMGSDQAGKQELPVELVREARLFCDLPSQSVSIGEFQHVGQDIASGAITLCAIGEVIAGRAPGRTDPREITIFDSSGIALQDIYVALAAVEADLQSQLRSWSGE